MFGVADAAQLAASTDLLGGSRLNGASVDAGAVERSSFVETPSAVVTTADDAVNPNDGRISLREALLYANGSVGTTVTFDERIFAKGETNVLRLNCGELGGLTVSSDVTVDAGEYLITPKYGVLYRTDYFRRKYAQRRRF